MKTIFSALLAVSVLAGIASSASALRADPPFSFACTTDGGMRVGCH
jgi:hypothetical protein